MTKPSSYGCSHLWKTKDTMYEDGEISEDLLCEKCGARRHDHYRLDESVITLSDGTIENSRPV